MEINGNYNVSIFIRLVGIPDPHHYNAPEMAPVIDVVIPGDGYTECLASRDIVLHAHTLGLTTYYRIPLCTRFVALCSFVPLRRKFLSFGDSSL